LLRSSHWYVKVKFQQAAKSLEHVDARCVASKEIGTHNAGAERTALATGAISRQIQNSNLSIFKSLKVLLEQLWHHVVLDIQLLLSGTTYLIIFAMLNILTFLNVN